MMYMKFWQEKWGFTLFWKSDILIAGAAMAFKDGRVFLHSDRCTPKCKCLMYYRGVSYS